MGYSRKWNRPQNEPSVGRRPSRVMGIALGLLFIVVALSAWYWFSKEEPKVKPTTTQAKPKKAKIISPPLPASTNSNVAAKPNKEMSEAWKKYYDGRDTNKWIVVKDPKTGKEYLSRLMKPGLKNRKPPLYKTHALNVLNAILFKDPGTPLPGMKIDDRFVKSFQEAILEKIEISNEDSEDDKRLKLAMIETMDFLKNEIKNGGDIKQIVGDALAERQRISTLKHMMIQERANMRNTGASEEEITAFENECNRRLAEKGASPLLTRQLLLERLEQKELQSKRK